MEHQQLAAKRLMSRIPAKMTCTVAGIQVQRNPPKRKEGAAIETEPGAQRVRQRMNHQQEEDRIPI